MKTFINNQTLELFEGDVSQQEVDVIVNAANGSLSGGGGVDGAIHRAGGPGIMAETNLLYRSGCPTGSAVISGAGNLDAKYVIHAVGPVWRGGNHGEAQYLASAYRKCLELAVERDCQSIAFPSLSTGAYRYPIQSAATIALSTNAGFLSSHGKPSLVRFVLFGDETYQVFKEVLTASNFGDT